MNIETNSYRHIDGKSYPIKDIRPFYNEQSFFSVSNLNSFLDEIVSRTEVYGEDSEDQSYKLFDTNVVQIVESGFDLSKIRSVKVPS